MIHVNESVRQRILCIVHVTDVLIGKYNDDKSPKVKMFVDVHKFRHNSAYYH